ALISSVFSYFVGAAKTETDVDIWSRRTRRHHPRRGRDRQLREGPRAAFHDAMMCGLVVGPKPRAEQFFAPLVVPVALHPRVKGLKQLRRHRADVGFGD